MRHKIHPLKRFGNFLEKEGTWKETFRCRADGQNTDHRFWLSGNLDSYLFPALQGKGDFMVTLLRNDTGPLWIMKRRFIS